MSEQPHDSAHAERRRSPRVKVGVAIEFKQTGATVASRAETADINLEGCYIEMAFTLPVGTKLDLVLWVEEHRLPAKGTVVTHHPQFGNGIEFHDMSAEDERKLAHFLQTKSEKPEGSPSV
jgi:PilZ domain-containing protein